MSEDDRPGSPERRVPRDAPAPWERPWAVTPGGPTPPPARRSLDSADEDQLSVADLLRKVGDPGAGRRRTTDGDPGDVTTDDPDTTVIPVYVDAAPAPLGGPTDRAERAEPREVVAVVDPVPEGIQTRLQAKKSLRQRRAATAGRSAVALTAVLVFAVTGLAWGGLRYVDSNVTEIQALDEGSTAIQQPEQQLGDENFLLIGSDTRAGASGELGAGDEEEVGGARSDTTMIAHIPADRSRVVIVSFPRDLEVDIPACDVWDNDTATYTDEVFPPQEGVKLNQAYFEGGPRCVTKVVQQLSGLNVNHFLGVDFAGFQSMVDALGGVEVCTERPLDDANLGLILPEAGPQVIDGAQALSYVRARYVAGDPTSDYGRIQRQQRLLGSLLRTALSQDTLLDLGKLKSFVDAVTASTFGENVGVQDLLTLAQSLQGIDAGRVTFVTAPTTGEANASGNEVLLTDVNDAVFRAVREGQPLPGEAEAAPDATTTTTPAPTTAAPTVRAVDPADVVFTVRNATSTGGLAGSAAAELADVGLLAAGTDNFGDLLSTTVVRHAAGDEAAALTLASAVPGTGTELVPGLAGGVELVLGEDYDGTTGFPTPAGQVLQGAGAPSAAPTAAPLPTDLSVVNGGDVSCG